MFFTCKFSLLEDISQFGSVLPYRNEDEDSKFGVNNVDDEP
jgi:hypothetical protein